MEDIMYDMERNRNVSSSFIMLIGALFIIAGVIVNEGIFSMDIVKYAVWGIGGLLFLGGMMYRFRPINENTEYV